VALGLGLRTMKEPARDAVGNLHVGVLLLFGGGLLLPSTHPDFGEASVDGAHRTGGDRAADKARNRATPEAHVTGRLVGPSISLTAAPLQELGKAGGSGKNSRARPTKPSDLLSERYRPFGFPRCVQTLRKRAGAVKAPLPRSREQRQRLVCAETVFLNELPSPPVTQPSAIARVACSAGGSGPRHFSRSRASASS
jgi:hypothetical protein